MIQTHKTVRRMIDLPALLLAVATLALLTACSNAEPDTPSDSPATAFGPADCNKLPDPKPADASATAATRAAQEGDAMRNACKNAVAAKTNERSDKDDLARIRQLMEQKHADEAATKRAREAWAQGLKDGAAAPLQTFKK